MFLCFRCVSALAVGTQFLLEESCGAGLHTGSFFCTGFHGIGPGWGRGGRGQPREQWGGAGCVPPLGGLWRQAAGDTFCVRHWGKAGTSCGHPFFGGYVLWNVFLLFVFKVMLLSSRSCHLSFCPLSAKFLFYNYCLSFWTFATKHSIVVHHHKSEYFVAIFLFYCCPQGQGQSEGWNLYSGGRVSCCTRLQTLSTGTL